MLSPVVIATAGTVLLLTVALHSHGSSPVPAPHCHNTSHWQSSQDGSRPTIISIQRCQAAVTQHRPASYCLLAGEQQPTER